VAIGVLNARMQKVIISLLNILDTIEEEIKELDRIVKDEGK
jgi:hypothetical protein